MELRNSKLVVLRDISVDESSVDPKTLEVSLIENKSDNLNVQGELLKKNYHIKLTFPQKFLQKQT